MFFIRCEKQNRPLVYRGTGKSQPSGPPFQWEAEFPTGTVNPRVGISLSPLDANDGFSLSYLVRNPEDMSSRVSFKRITLIGFSLYRLEFEPSSDMAL